MKRFHLSVFTILILCATCAEAPAADNFITGAGGTTVQRIVLDEAEWEGVRMAAGNLAADFGKVTGVTPPVTAKKTLSLGKNTLTVGTVGHSSIDILLTADELRQLDGAVEKYLIIVRDGGVILAGSDKRGTTYGIYTVSEQMGVSPWYWWADVPVRHRDRVGFIPGTYTDGEPAVRYRGIFLNDEAPCLTSWVKNTFGTDFGGHEFYARVFELLLRLKANFLWPAMWGWSFYADDPQNSRLADTMGIVMGTSHHEPMARNHQEWARNRDSYGVWDYASNKEVIDRFFTEGMERARNTEDLITIGMRGDGDTALGGKEGHDDEYVSRDAENMALLEDIFRNQRRIISEVTGKSADERPQVWALYKEVQKFYELGLRVPDDVTILLSDDNWGDVRKLPNETERTRRGGWGMYYHVDYVGAPRNSKWLNITPIQNLWEQMQLTYAYGVDRLWVLNVGDLKPMEYPIDLFLSIAWNPVRYNAGNLLQHTLEFCKEQFGDAASAEAARIINLYSKFSGRTTVEMMDHTTYDLASGEFKSARDELLKLEAEALRQYADLEDEYRDAYSQLVLFPVQALTNIYEMYYAQAMNLSLAAKGDPRANEWAGEVARCFKRDSALTYRYNKVMSGGKWDGMMTQKHIGYRGWNDDFPADRMPATKTVDSDVRWSFPLDGRGYTSIEAEHFHDAVNPADALWTTIPYMGRTLSGLAVMPYTVPTEGAELKYRIELPADIDSVKVHVIVKSTLAFNGTGHRYELQIGDNAPVAVLFNGNLNEEPANIYSVYYPTVSRRVVDSAVDLKCNGGWTFLKIRPLDPGIVFEKIVVDYGGYTAQFLFGEESSPEVEPM